MPTPEPAPGTRPHRADHARPRGPAQARRPADIQKRTWCYVARKVRREFSDDQCTDLAAALTYYGVLAIFPAVLALSAILGLVGQAEKSVQTVLDVIQPLSPRTTLGPSSRRCSSSPRRRAPGWALLLGLLGALWSASGYVGAFGRAMNRIYEIGEGRPFWKLRPIMLLITLVTILLVALVLLMLVLSGPLAQSIGDQIGLGDRGGPGLEHRQVAGHGRRGDADRRDPLLRHAQREAAASSAGSPSARPSRS